MRKAMLILIVVVFYCGYGNAQGYDVAARIDSLKNQLRVIHGDTSAIRMLNELAETFQFKSMDSCLKYANIALSLSDKLLNTDVVKKNLEYTIKCKLLKARAIENIASSLEQSNTPGALATYQKALDLEAETGNKEAVAHTYEWIGNMYYYGFNKF